MARYKTAYSHESGFSLVELLVGLVIGLFATLVVMQTFSVFEGQKRTTSGNADAQTNGMIALMQLQRHLQTAGYGMPMPMADFENNLLTCTNDVGLDNFPISIVNGANGDGGDRIISRYSTAAGGGGVPIEIVNATASTTDGMAVSNNIGCNSDLEMTAAVYNERFQDASEDEDKMPNRVMILSGGRCAMAKIAKQPTNVTNGHSYIKLVDPPSSTELPGWTASGASRLACIGDYGSKTLDVVNGELQLDSSPVVSGIVTMQAQYGVSNTLGSYTVDNWVDASGAWATPSIDARNRIRAVKVAIVLRNGLKEKENVSTADSVEWPDTGDNIDVSFLGDWQQYRYRVFATTVPLRNMIWSREALE